MSHKISSNTVNNLAHDITEIRVRALKQIEGKITRAFLQNESILFNSGVLLKQLIRWFGQKHLTEEDTVLKLMIKILQSNHSDEAIQFLGLQRIKKEVNKIYEIVKTSQAKKLVCDVREILNERVELKEDDANKVIDITSSRSELSAIDLYYANAVDDEFSSDCEQPWSIPSVPDYNSLKYLSDSLNSDCAEEELKHAIEYLQTAINDFPAEYFLQPPHIFKALLALYGKDKRRSEILLKTMINLTKSMLGRVKIRKLVATHSPNQLENKAMKSNTQITVSRFCVELFNICLEQLKDLYDDDRSDTVVIYSLLFEVLNLIEQDPISLVPKNSILLDLAYIARSYRQSLEIDLKPSRTNRMRYIIIISLMVKVAKSDNELQNLCQSRNPSEYNPNNYLYSSIDGSRQSILENQSEIWYVELENSLLDLPLQKLYPDLHDNIKNAIGLATQRQISTIRILLNCEKSLMPVVKLLRQPDDISHEEFILTGLEALETFSIVRSSDLVKKIVQSISRSTHLFDGNLVLKNAAENILLRLFAHENLKLKRCVYKEASNSMKQFFARLMDGEDVLNIMHNPNSNKAQCLGIPLTIEILTEIICFGCRDSDLVVRSCAETMISLLLRGKTLLDNHWEMFLEIMIPNLPLLQCLDSKDATLRSMTVDMLNPDNDFPLLEMFQGNLRFLFFDDEIIRSEAIARIVYIVSSHSQSDCYVPNVIQISDTLPNDICIVTAPRKPENIFPGGFYDRSSVYPLLELLKTTDIEPSVRKTTLLQLNVVCQDSQLVEIVHNENVLYLVLVVLENSLKADPVIDYPDAVIPAIGILSKIALCIPQIRRELSADGKVYILLIRAMFIFHHDMNLQQDCSLLLFLLAFSSYIVGSKQITLPQICSRLKMPIQCEFHWNTSPFYQKSLLEEIYLDVSRNTRNTSLTRQSTSSVASQMPSIITMDVCEKQACKPLESKDLGEYPFIYESIHQFIRLTFASLWFEGFDSLLKTLQKAKNSHNKLEYSLIPQTLHQAQSENFIKICDTLNFNRNLELTNNDCLLIRYSSVKHNINTFLRNVSNATNAQDVIRNVDQIKLCLILCENHDKNEAFLKTFQKFLLIIPNTETEKMIFETVTELMTILLKRGNEIILNWILEDIKDPNCVLLVLLKNYTCSLSLYKNVCEFLKTLIKISNKTQQNTQNTAKKLDNKRCELWNMFNNLFEHIVPIVEECFHKRLLDRFRSLLSLMHTLSCNEFLEFDSGYVTLVVKKLLYFMRTLKSFTQAGSHLNKNCLYIIGNIMRTADENSLSKEHVRFLSGLCGHADFQIRALSWSILGRLCKCFQGAKLVVQELSFLPGGFHASCLCTFLDIMEVPMVRESAGNVFSTLLTHTNKDSGQGLHIAVAPLCIEKEPTATDDGIELIMEIFARHRFFQTISHSLEQFHISVLLCGTRINEITTCEIIKSYCSIFINLIDRKPDLIEKLLETPTQRIFELIKSVPTCITKSSLEMLGEICNLLLRFFENGTQFLQRIITRDQELIKVLISLVNVSYFDDVVLTALVSILQVLRSLSNETLAFQCICETINIRYSEQFGELLIWSLASNQNEELQSSSLKFITSLLVKSQTEQFKFQTISQIFDCTQVKWDENMENSKWKCISSPNKESIVEKTAAMPNLSLNERHASSTTISELLFWKMSDLFNRSFSVQRCRTLQSISLREILLCESLASLLKTCSKARNSAVESNFLRTIIKRFQFVFKHLGMPCTDFIRKYGDSKKEPIMQEFIILYGIVLNWFSSATLTDEEVILEFSKVVIQSWPWINHSSELKQQLLKCLAFLSEDSVLVCKQLSSPIATYSHSVLQLTINLAQSETNKVKHPSIDLSILEIALRIISNCCSCIEGRLQINKSNLLEVFDKFHPSITKLHKPWNTITMLWLRFREIYSRYPEGAIVRHLALICTLVAKGSSQMRILCLSLLRNFTFVTTNRPALLSSEDFLYTTNIILKEGNAEEQLLVATAIWRLVADNYKAKHAIKSTSIPKRLKHVATRISNESSVTEQIDLDLVNVTEIILKILN